MPVDHKYESHVPPLRFGRKITGMSAILLPLATATDIDWPGFRAHVERTARVGLTPAINMDTGYANLISNDQRERALAEAVDVLDGAPFIAGAFVSDSPDATFDFDAYRSAIDQITKYGGTPIIFQSYGLTNQSDDNIVNAYYRIGSHIDSFLAFELGQMFAPFGRIYNIDVYEGLIRVPQCKGAKHSSLSRQLEWERLRVRDATRPDFMVLTGNDLAIDMVMYGSDYLLGLSTFAPDAFALRDQYWLEEDARFYELNDLLQYLGFFAFRNPVPAYKHNAAQFLHARNWIASSLTLAGSPRRPDSDEPILHDILLRLQSLVG